MRVRDDFELLLVKLGGQHLKGCQVVHRLAAGIVQAKHLSGQGQRVSFVGIHDQEFFFNTESTHVLSVTDESDSKGPRVSIGAQGPPWSRLGG
jgi:hypothetical protein